MVVVKNLNSFFHVVFPCTGSQREVEEGFVGMQRELVHGINGRKIIQDEEKDGAAQSTRLILTGSSINFLGSFLRNLRSFGQIETSQNEVL